MPISRDEHGHTVVVLGHQDVTLWGSGHDEAAAGVLSLCVKGLEFVYDDGLKEIRGRKADGQLEKVFIRFADTDALAHFVTLAASVLAERLRSDHQAKWCAWRNPL